MAQDPKTLRLFVAAAESGSISEAARRCHIVLAAASRRIATLESRSGVALLTRHARGVAPTAAGRAFLTHARAALAALDRIEDELGEFREGLKGVVSVTANASTLAQFLPADVGAFLREHPGLRIELQERASAEAVRRVVSGASDIAVFESGAQTDAVRTLPYREDRLALVVAAGHSLARRRRVDEEALFAHEHVMLDEGTALHRQLTAIAVRTGRPLRSRIHVGSFDAVCRMVEQGVGVAVLPIEAIAPQCRAMRIRAITLDVPWAVRRHLLGTRRSAPLTTAAAALLKHLAAAR